MFYCCPLLEANNNELVTSIDTQYDLLSFSFKALDSRSLNI